MSLEKKKKKSETCKRKCGATSHSEDRTLMNPHY